MIDTEKLDKLQKYSRAIAALSLAIFLTLILVSFWSLWRIRNEITSLDREKRSLEEKKQSLTEEVQALEAQRAVLNQTISKIAEERPDTVKEAINQATADPLEKPATDPGDKRVAYTRQAIAQLVQTAPSVARSLPLIYLQIGEESQRPQARRIAQQLKQAGYVVPGIENVGVRMQRGPTQVRCNARNDAEKEAAQKIIDLLQSWGVKAQFQPLPAGSKPWQYEIWFGSDFN